MGIQLSSFVTLAVAMYSSYEQDAEKQTDVDMPYALTIYTEEFPPYNFQKDGTLTGINLELTKLACEKAKIQCEFILLPWNRAFKLTLNTPHSGLISTARTNERKNAFTWVGPLASSQSCLFRLSTRTDIKIESLDDIKRYRLGNSADDSYGNFHKAAGLVEGKNLFLYQRKFGDVKPFAAGRVDLIVGSPMSISKQLSRAELALEDIVPIFKVNPRLLNGNYLALNKRVPEKVAIKLQAAIETLKQQGEIKELRQQFADNSSSDISESIADGELWRDCVLLQ